MHQFLMQGSELAYTDIPDNSNEELTREETDSIEAHRRADGDLGHTIDETDEVNDLHIGRAGFVEDGINHHVHGYSVKETAFEQNSGAIGNTDGDENTVTGTGRLKVGIQDDANGRAERKKNERAIRQLTQQEMLRQQLSALNERIERLGRQKAQVDENISNLREAREILADNELNADTERGRQLRQRLGQLDSGLRQNGVDIGVQTDANGRIINADEARNTAAREQTEQEAESARLEREIGEARQEREQFLRENPEMRAVDSEYYSDVAASRTDEEAAAYVTRTAAVSDASLQSAVASAALADVSLEDREAHPPPSYSVASLFNNDEIIAAANADIDARGGVLVDADIGADDNVVLASVSQDTDIVATPASFIDTSASDDGAQFADPFAVADASGADFSDPFGGASGGTQFSDPFAASPADGSTDSNIVTASFSDPFAMEGNRDFGSFAGTQDATVITAKFEAVASGEPVVVAEAAAPAADPAIKVDEQQQVDTGSTQRTMAMV